MRETKVYGWGVYRHFIETIWRPIQHVLRSSSAVAIFFFLALCAGVLVAVRFLDESTVLSLSGKSLERTTQDMYETIKEIPLNCSFVNHVTRSSCPASYYVDPSLHEDVVPSSTCPEYFRWLYEDLRTWRKTGISREMVMSGQRTANFRLVIVNGSAYVEKYRKAFQTRDTFTLWGILQLLRRYPGKVPDLDLMFDCGDRPVIEARHYFQGSSSTSPGPPPLFKYCANDETLDISFPDWSFWGWPEVNIKPWEGLLKDLKQGNEKINWVDREPYAYWKGNPSVDATRQNLLTCNVSESQDWGAHLYSQDWLEEEKQGFNQSNLANQCTHKYKIYIEGVAWSVSEKYILACDSPMLLVEPRFYDFFSRGLVPLKHYWPIKNDDKCRSIKHAVDWGNNHPQQAQQFGKAGTNFVEEELKMEYVYDYMFHLLTQYAKLLNYKPSVPPQAVELCSEVMFCPATGLEKQFMMDSLVKAPSRTPPCTMPPPFDPATLHSFIHTKQNSINQVDSWENQYWNNHKNTTHI